jgi:hypothetical protein
MIKTIISLLEVVPVNTWDHGFLESVKLQLDKAYTLSDRQKEMIDKINKEHSPEELLAEAAWKENYGSEQKEIATVCARYYEGTVYYQDLVYEILNNKKFVPSRKQFNKMTENKYAKRIVSAFNAKPKYDLGAMIMLRMGAPRQYSGNFNLGVTSDCARYVIVIENNGFPVNACKGAKVYNVLPVGGKEAFSIEERYLKKARIKRENKKNGNEKETQEDSTGQW